MNGTYSSTSSPRIGAPCAGGDRTADTPFQLHRALDVYVARAQGGATHEALLARSAMREMLESQFQSIVSWVPSALDLTGLKDHLHSSAFRLILQRYATSLFGETDFALILPRFARGELNVLSRIRKSFPDISMLAVPVDDTMLDELGRADLTGIEDRQGGHPFTVLLLDWVQGVVHPQFSPGVSFAHSPMCFAPMPGCADGTPASHHHQAMQLREVFRYQSLAADIPPRLERPGFARPGAAHVAAVAHRLSAGADEQMVEARLEAVFRSRPEETLTLSQVFEAAALPVGENPHRSLVRVAMKMTANGARLEVRGRGDARSIHCRYVPGYVPIGSAEVLHVVRQAGSHFMTPDEILVRASATREPLNRDVVETTLELNRHAVECMPSPDGSTAYRLAHIDMTDE